MGNNAVKFDAFDEFRFAQHWQHDPPDLRDEAKKKYRDGAQDIFSSLFKKRWEYADDAPKAPKDYIETLKSTEEYKALRESTTMKAGPAYAATKKLLAAYMNQVDTQQDKSEEGQRRARVSARQKLRDAADAADQYEEMEQLLGLGGGDTPGPEGGTEEAPNSADKIALMKKFLENRELVRLLKVGGRVVNIADSALHNEITRGVAKLVGIEFGDDLNRIMPGELWALDAPEFFLYRYVQKDFQQYQYGAETVKGLGPLVLCLDKSSSMSSNNRWDYARAVLLGMIQIAHKQRRALYVIVFNGYADSPVKMRTVAQMAEWVMKLKNGGNTNFDKPLCVALEVITTQEKAADIVFLTDGDATISVTTAMRINKLRGDKLLKMFGVCVGDKPGSLVGVSDDVVTLDRLMSGDDLTDEARAATAKIFKGVIR